MCGGLGWGVAHHIYSKWSVANYRVIGEGDHQQLIELYKDNVLMRFRDH